jgi:hypothetical protein
MSMLTTAMAGRPMLPMPANGTAAGPCPEPRCAANRGELVALRDRLAAAEAQLEVARSAHVRAAAEWATDDIGALGIDPERLSPLLRRTLAELLPVGSSHTTAGLLRRLYGGIGCTSTITTLIWRLRVALGGQPYTVRGRRASGVYRLDAATPAEVAAGRYVVGTNHARPHFVPRHKVEAVLARPEASQSALMRELHMGKETIRAIRDGTHPVLREVEDAR